MPLEYGTWGHGGTVYPLTSSTDNALLEDADPALFHATAFLAGALQIHLGRRLQNEADELQLKLSQVVRKTVNVEPTPLLQTTQLQFPLFALYRKGETHTRHTASWDKDVSEWEFAYLLPALTPPQQDRLCPILRAVVRTIAHALKQGYEPGYKADHSVWDVAGLQSIRLVSAQYKTFEATDAVKGYYRAVVGTIEAVERDMPVPDAFEPFDGADVHVNEQAADGTIVTDVALVATHPAPTIATVSPNSGSKDGGTVITITGTNFRGPMELRIGTMLVAVVVVSPTVATAVTPPHSAYPTFMADVTLTAFDGQSVTKPAGFTFTTP